MANKLILKKSAVTSKAPLTTDIEYGELAINYADGKLYYKKSNDVIDSFISQSNDYLVLPTVATATGDIHGIVTRTDSTIYFINGTRTFTVQPVGASWTYYDKGTLHTVSTTKSIVIANTSGSRFIYIDPSTENLVEASGAPDFAQYVYLAYIYWDASNSKCVILGDERHGSKRDTTWHSNQHLNVGTIWRSGGSITYTLNSDATVTIGLGTPLVIADEDLAHNIVHSATPAADYEQVLNTSASLEVLYLSGTTYIATAANTIPWIAGTSLARINQITSGSGSLVDASEGSYITYWLVATNDVRSPVKLVLGRIANATLDDAYAEDFTEYGLSFAEQVFMYQIVLKTSSAFTGNTPKVQIAGVRKILTKVASGQAIVSATEHNNLTGRDVADSHTISAVTNLQSTLNGKQATLVSGTNIKSVGGVTLLGSGDLTSFSSALSITNATASTSTATGALKITGGVGIGGNLSLGAGIYLGASLGTNGQVITSNGTTASWSTFSATGTLVATRYITSGTTYTPTAGTTKILIQMVGGGGGGGGADNQYSFAAGGGAGGYVQKFVTGISSATTYTIAIGTAGTAGTNLGAAGGNGGSTTFTTDAAATPASTTFTAGGGTGGNGSTSGSTKTATAGGNGGTATNGDINASGAPGGPAMSRGGTEGGFSGTGGSSPFGGGGRSIAPHQAADTAGFAAGGRGAGGGGAYANSATGAAGGAGTAGLIVIYEFA